jgi:undecaprenyl-diphosphatase
LGSHAPDGTTRALLIVAVTCVVAFLVLAVLAAGPVPLPVEASLIAFAQELPVPQRAWEGLTALGRWTLLVAINALVVGNLAIRRETGFAILVAGSLVVAAAAVLLARELIDRPRLEDALVLTSGGSLPSGHAFFSALTYGLLWVVIARGRRTARTRLVLALAAAGTVVLVGLSRIALGAHYPADVLAGWLLGVAALAVMAALASILPWVAAADGSPDPLHAPHAPPPPKR